MKWCPGKESYAITDRTNRCSSFVWWRKCLARWRTFATSRNPPSREPCLSLAGSLTCWEASLGPAPLLICRVADGSGLKRQPVLGPQSEADDSRDWLLQPLLDWLSR